MILDTNAASKLLDEHPPEALLRKLSPSPLHQLPVIVIGEIRYGLQLSRKRAEIETKLHLLIEISHVLAIDEATSEFYAEIRADLHRRGSPIPTNDLWIAALAKQHNLPVVTKDEHFRRVQGLQVVSW